MVHTALISFVVNSITIRMLSSYLKMNGYDTACFFCPGIFNEENSKELIKILKEKKTSLVGISVLTDYYYAAVSVTKLIKKNIGIPVIWGGAHVDVRPEECLRHADIICMGEGEEALLELAGNLSLRRQLNTDIKNICFKTENGIIRNDLRNIEENLDKYPFPDYAPDTQYLMNERGFDKWREEFLQKQYHIMTSRGCPYNCAYCYNNYRRKQYQGKGKYLRMRSVENVIQELIQAKKIYKDLQSILFLDDNFLNRSLAELDRFKELYLKKVNGIPFYLLTDPRLFDEKKIKILRDCGLHKMQIGIQSGSEWLNKEVYNRPVFNKEILEMARCINQLGIKVVYDIIFNNPYETRDDIIRTVELLLKLSGPFSVQGYNLIFYPGTDITNKALKDGYISLKRDKDDFSTIQGTYNSPLHMTRKDVFSSRFYSISFNTRGKKYWNQLIFMLKFRHIPDSLIRFLIRFFLKSDTFYKKAALNGIISFYLICRSIRNWYGVKWTR